MNIYEIDWRISTTELILTALTAGLQDLIRQLEIAEQDDDDWFGIEEAVELSEGIYGMAFLAAQNYITGTVSDIKMIYRKVPEAETRFKKHELIKEHNDCLSKLPITQLQLCDAVANYYKHHEEWDDWQPIGKRKHTIPALQSAHIGENDSYPCHKAAQLLLPDTGEDLSPLATILRNWRSDTISSIK